MSIPLVLLGPAAASAADGDLATAPPSDVLARAKTDLAKVKSYHLAGTLKEKKAVTHIAADVSTTGGARMTLREGSASIQMVVLRNAMYLKANAAYWKQAAGKGDKAAAVARKLAGRWVKESGDDGKELESLLGDLAPKHMASCIDTGLGTLKNEGAQTLGGTKVVVIRDAGEKPGTSPGLLYVSAEGRALPLRLKQTGPTKPGGKVDKKCGGGDDDSTAEDLAFSRFDAVAKVTAPRGARTVEQIVGGGSGTSV